MNYFDEDPITKYPALDLLINSVLFSECFNYELFYDPLDYWSALAFSTVFDCCSFLVFIAEANPFFISIGLGVAATVALVAFCYETIPLNSKNFFFEILHPESV